MNRYLKIALDLTLKIELLVICSYLLLFVFTIKHIMMLASILVLEYPMILIFVVFMFVWLKIRRKKTKKPIDSLPDFSKKILLSFILLLTIEKIIITLQYYNIFNFNFNLK